MMTSEGDPFENRDALFEVNHAVGKERGEGKGKVDAVGDVDPAAVAVRPGYQDVATSAPSGI